MEIKIIETSEIKELCYNDINSNVDGTEDFIGNAGGLLEDFYYSEAEEVYFSTQENFEWWANIIKRYEEMDEKISSYLNSFHEEKEEKEEKLWRECNCEFSDTPSVVVTYIEDAIQKEGE